MIFHTHVRSLLDQTHAARARSAPPPREASRGSRSSARSARLIHVSAPGPNTIGARCSDGSGQRVSVRRAPAQPFYCHKMQLENGCLEDFANLKASFFLFGYACAYMTRTRAQPCAQPKGKKRNFQVVKVFYSKQPFSSLVL